MALLRRDRSDGAEADEAEPRRRRGASSERQLAASVSSLRLAARVVRWVAGLFAVVIALGILFVVLDANPHNAIASTIHDWAVALVGPFKNLFHPKTPKLTVAVNWGVIWWSAGSSPGCCAAWPVAWRPTDRSSRFWLGLNRTLA